MAVQSRGLTQPNGAVIPSDDEVRSELVALGDSVEPRTDARTLPETFRPTGVLTFTLLQRFTNLRNSFGWYNVTGRAPQPGELYELIHCDDPPAIWERSSANDTVRDLNISSDPNYLGGEIGFFQAAARNRGSCARVNDASTLSAIMYSQKEFNPEVSNPPFIHLLIMDSKVYPSVFYFAWEDLLSGGDNDFSDLVLRVAGITCAGGGRSCDSGQRGVCASGVTYCENGEVRCRAARQPSAERCNGLDDDCNGGPDDGELCAPGERCERGACTDPCGAVTCAEGLVCRAGECIDPCAGVVCPFGQQCRAGECADPCLGVTCPENQRCVSGECTGGCLLDGCPARQTCDAELGRCIDPDCAGPTCETGTHCESGSCVDDCLNAVCPSGQSCVSGTCRDDVVDPGAGGTAGSGGVTGSGGTAGGGGSGSMGGASSSGGMAGSAAAGGDASSGGANGSTGTSGGASARPSDGENATRANDSGDVGGCACRAAPGARTHAWLVVLALALSAARRRRSRAKRVRS